MHRNELTDNNCQTPYLVNCLKVEPGFMASETPGLYGNMKKYR